MSKEQEEQAEGDDSAACQGPRATALMSEVVHGCGSNSIVPEGEAVVEKVQWGDVSARKEGEGLLWLTSSRIGVGATNRPKKAQHVSCTVGEREMQD